MENTTSSNSLLINGTFPSIVAINVEKTAWIATDEMRIIFEVVNYVILTGLISLCGMVTNTINIIVFRRQGLTDSVTLSLLGLSVSDFGASITHVWMSICFNPFFIHSDIPFHSPTVQYLTAGWPHVCCSQISNLITAFITLERCLCIAIPLKVKNILTPRRTFVVILMIYLTIIASTSPVYFGIRFRRVFNTARNRTIVDLVYVDGGITMENVSLLINSCTQLTAFALVIVCSLFLVNELREKSKWREKSSSFGAKADGSSSRDNKVVKMVSIVATVFIVCYFPSATNYIIVSAFEEYSVVGQYKNLFLIMWSVFTVMEATNAAVNICVYYWMSTKYRVEFRRLFGLSREDDK